jgi:hypothetical protein
MLQSYSVNTEGAAKPTGTKHNISARLRGLDTLMGKGGKEYEYKNNKYL